MNISVKIPFDRIKQSINKVELTHIDRFLTSNQKKRVARFYREEAAKRTHYKLEPVWTIPESVQLVKTYQSEPLVEPTTADSEDVLEVMPEGVHNHVAMKKPEEPDVSTSPDTTITDRDDTEPVDTEALEVGTSPLSESSSRSSHGSSPESDPVQNLLTQLFKKNNGSYNDFKKEVITIKKFTKEFGDISNTQLKKLIYQEKTRQIKDLRRQHQQ